MRPVSALIISAFTLLLSACQVYNSSSGDEMAFSGGAIAVLQTKCSQCHNYAYMTSDQLVSAGLIIRGAAEQSKLYLRIKGSGGSSADMPPSGATGGDVGASDLALLKSWIDSL